MEDQRQGDDVCICDTSADVYQDDNFDACVANAYLIAAAPELLQSLIELVAQNEHDNGKCFVYEPENCAACKAKQIIAKATGK
jgi:hypothetical protein